ncbi:MAG TPA: GntP family permease [Solirubrobacteraceae bacterium]|nr:GntP family permease [Solirubrobacteraceae bacterium]
MDEPIDPALSTGPLLLIALGAVLLLLFLIIKVRLHAFVALVLVSFLTAIATRIPTAEIADTLTEGLGTTLGSVALLVGFGAMIGRLLETSGGAQVLADTLLRKFREDRAPLALGLAALLFGFPIFFDAGLVVFLPLVFTVARRMGGSLLRFGLPVAAAFSVMHAFVPPHPGPVAAAELIGAELGLVLLFGLIVALPTWFLGGYLFGIWTGQRIHVPVPDLLGEEEKVEEDTAIASEPPSLGTVLAVLLLPLLLIFLNTGLSTLGGEGVVQEDNDLVKALILVGETPIALLITVIAAMYLLGWRRRRPGDEVQEVAESAIGPVASIILITGAGGMFGAVLRAGGIGEALASSLEDIGLPVIVAAFVIAVALRVAQGSATVALTTTGGLIAPVVESTEGLTDPDLALIVVAIAGGSIVLSHFNDSGFWLVGKFFGMDERTTLRTWTVMETLLGSIGFAFAFVLSQIF